MRRYLIAILFLLAFSSQAWAQKDFSLSISPSSQTINAGRQTVFTVTALPVNNFKKPIALTVASNPASSDLTVSLSSTVISPGTSTMVTVTASPNANAQRVLISISGVAKNRNRVTQADLTINVPQFSLSVDPPTATVTQGDQLNFTVRSQGEQDFARDIGLSVSISPSAAFQLSKSTLTATDSATLQFNTAGITPGVYVATITATSGQLQRTAPITFTVIAKPVSTAPNLQILLPSVTLRSDQGGSHLVITGLVQNVGNGDAAFVKVNFKVFDLNNQLRETGSTFINGFPGLTSTNVFTNSTLPRGKTASFQRTFNLSFISTTQRIDFSLDFQADTLTAPKANLVIDSLTRTINNLRGSTFSVVVRNIGTVGARSPQIVIDSFDRANQIFDVTLAGSGDPNDVLAAGQTRTFTVNNNLPFDQTRINEQHAIWFDTNTSTITESLEDLSGQQLELKRNQIIEMQRMAHNLLLMK